jgi:F-type H+-transporting ATPase subunit g
MQSLPLLALMSQARPKFANFMRYAAIELTPPSPTDLPAIKNGIVKLVSGVKTGAWKNLTVRDATLNTLVAMEIGFWFYVGECIGKRHIVGYNV